MGSDTREFLEPSDGGRDLTLNEVAVRLGRVPQMGTKGKIAVSPLLSLLRDGSLQAVALYPSQLIPRIKVPRGYWDSIDSADFKQIINVPGKRARRGTYLIRVDALFDNYLEEAIVAANTSASSEERDQKLRADIRAVVNCLGEKREVTVPEEDWVRLSSEKKWTEDEGAVSRGRGRPEKAWGDVVPFLVLEIAGPELPQKQKNEEIAKRVFQAAKARNILDPPSESSLIRKVEEIYREMRKLQQK